MHTVIRHYTGKGAKEVFDALEKNKPLVEKTLRSVKGFVSYSLVRTADGGFSVSIAQDKAGTDESSRKAAEVVKQIAADTGAGAPAVFEGTVILQLN